MKQEYLNKMNQVIAVVAKHSFYSPEEVLNIIQYKNRKTKLTKIRFIFYYLCDVERIPKKTITDYLDIDRSYFYNGIDKVTNALIYNEKNTQFYKNCIENFKNIKEENNSIIIVSSFEDNTYDPLDDNYYKFEEFLIHSKTKKAFREHNSYLRLKNTGMTTLDIAIKHKRSYRHVSTIIKQMLEKKNE